MPGTPRAAAQNHGLRPPPLARAGHLKASGYGGKHGGGRTIPRTRGDLREAVQGLKDATPAGLLLGRGALATALDRLDLIDEDRVLLQPRIAGHGPPLFQGGLPATRRLELVSATPLHNGAVAMHYRRAG